MKKLNKIITLFSTIAVPCAAVTPLLTGCSSDQSREVHILDINDIHGAMDGWGDDTVDVSASKPGCLRLAREVNKVMDQYPGSVFLSAGDENSGDSWSVCTKGESTYPILKQMGIRYAAVGNHAFEWGLEDMSSLKYDKLARTDETEGNYFVCSNILNTNLFQNKEWCIDPENEKFLEDYTTWQQQQVSWADPYKILNLKGCKVCLIGLTTNNTLIDGNKKVSGQLSFIDYNAAVHYTKYQIYQDLGKSAYEGIDSFILLTHIGSTYTDHVLAGEAIELAQTIDTDVDAIISSHSHATGTGKIWNNKLNKPICIGQAGANGANFLDTKLVFNPKAKKGKKLESIDMSVHKVPCPDAKHLAEAKEEWKELLNTTDTKLKKVADEFKKQAVIVSSKISEQLSESVLEQTEMQYPDKYYGYYNGTKHQAEGWQVGHHYYDNPDILDHFAGWFCRALMIGYDMNHWSDISAGEAPIPSCAFCTQDSAPAQLQLGNITLREMFNMQPYDNYARVSYVSVYQLANIFNYALSGKPNKAGTKGFNYETKNRYQPNLNFYVHADKSSTKSSLSYDRVGFDIKDETDSKKWDIDSAYTCGPLMWYGVRVHLTEITENEKLLTYDTEKQKEIPVYDETATYRIDTETATVSIEGVEKQLIIPKMEIYDGSELNFGTIDNPALWHDAKWWLEKEFPDPNSGAKPKLIPVLTNNFMYDDGNLQNKMFKRYNNYNLLTKSFDFMLYSASENIRDDLTDFCKYSTPSSHEWIEFEAPTNIVWAKIKDLVQIA